MNEQLQHQRLKSSREALKLTPDEFGLPLGYTRYDIQKRENGLITKLSSEFAKDIERYHGISSKWLLEGKGEMIIKKTKINSKRS